ncbi:unnamed protein product, partial [Coccothraustes coccothraustes]
MQPPPRTRRPRPACALPARCQHRLRSPPPPLGAPRCCRGCDPLRAGAQGLRSAPCPAARAAIRSVPGCRGCDPLRARLPGLRSSPCPAAGAALRSVPGCRGCAPLRAGAAPAGAAQDAAGGRAPGAGEPPRPPPQAPGDAADCPALPCV